MSKVDKIYSQINRIRKLNAVQKSGYLSELDTLSDRLKDRTFKLAVIGEFSSGKSTFINAIIGKDILKHKPNETTATVTYIYNVTCDDSRINTCEVEYSNGKRIQLPDLSQLEEYTTVNTEINVAETIKSVSIYVNFLNVDNPIVITDTPGLNGIADRHRDITLDEIKKAHACIYLLSSNGVKSTDFDFIRILLNYQSRFIFIQNFIDTLRQSEGETIQTKIARDKENLRICFGEDNMDVNYQIYGISAIKALASRDLDKDKVFDEDTCRILDRNKLFDESNFSEFEKGLLEIIESGEYLNVIEDSAKHTLKLIIDKIMYNISEECELNEQLKLKDDKAKCIEKAKKVIERIESQKEDQNKRLQNFLVSRDCENRHSLYEYTKRCLQVLLEFLCSDLDEKAKTYEEFVTFENYYGAEPPIYYCRYIANYINGKLVPDIDGRIQDNLSHLYDEAILRVSNFVTSVPKTEEQIRIEINNNIEEFNGDAIQTDFEKYRIEVETKKNRITRMESNIKSMHGQKISVEHDICLEMQNSKQERQQYEQDKRNLGNDPGVKQRRVQKTRTVARTGLFKGFRDWLFGEKTETYWANEPDYSEQNEWKRRKNLLEEKNRRMQDLHMQRMSVLENKKKSIQDEISSSSKAIERLKNDITDLEGRAKREQDIYERTLKANKQEYCENEKRKLKEEFTRVLLRSEEKSSSFERINKHIDDVDLKYLPFIQEKVLKYYSDSIRGRVEGLKELIMCNEKELEAKYELSKKELGVLNDALQHI